MNDYTGGAQKFFLPLWFLRHYFSLMVFLFS